MALAHLERVCAADYVPSERDFLPQLWDALQYSQSGDQPRHDRLWTRDASLEDNLRYLVDVIDDLLPPMRRWAEFDCMPFILRRVKRCKYVYTERRSIRCLRRGYVHLTLFTRASHQDVWVSAHRFSLWAMRGMPPNEDQACALHTCRPQENSACVSRAHLTWGSARENARHRMENARR